MTIIELKKLKKNFGTLSVLKGVSLSIEAGLTVAILGPNGSGKTTIMKSLLGLVKPDSGELWFRGELLTAKAINDGAYRQNIGYMPQIARFEENMTAREMLAMVRDIRNTTASHQLTKYVEELTRLFGLETQLDKPLKTLSGGTRQKVNAVLAFMFEPELLMLDEPTAGLDPIAASNLKDLILAEKKRGRTIVLTSHVMSDIEELSDIIVLLVEGTIYFQGSINELLGQTQERTIERAIARILKSQSTKNIKDHEHSR